MTKFMTLSADNFPAGFYSEDVHGAHTNPDCLIPTNAIEITDEQWREFLANQGLRKWIDGAVVEYVPPPAPLPIPQSISDRQFFQQLSIDGIITEADALAANAAVIPQPLLDIIEAMPAEQQFAAKMLVSGATVFERNHPMTITIGTFCGWTSAQIDDFFRAAALL